MGVSRDSHGMERDEWRRAVCLRCPRHPPPLHTQIKARHGEAREKWMNGLNDHDHYTITRPTKCYHSSAPVGSPLNNTKPTHDYPQSTHRQYMPWYAQTRQSNPIQARDLSRSTRPMHRPVRIVVVAATLFSAQPKKPKTPNSSVCVCV